MRTYLYKKSNANYTKEEKEAAKKKTLPLNQFTYSISPNKGLYILNNKSENKALKPGTEIIAIDGKPVQNIIDQIEQSISTDGFNVTHQNISLERTFAQRYKIYYPMADSLLVKYRVNNDSIAETIVNIIHKKKVDTVKILKPVIAKIAPVKKLKYRGNYEEGKPQLDFKFLGKSKDFAYMKILSFSIPNANYEMFYKECFDSIKRVGSQNLIIDLRNNGGGSLDASRNLFAYLTDKEFVYLGKPITNGYFDQRKYGNGFQKVSYFLFGHNDKDDINIDEAGNLYTFMKGARPLPPNKKNFKGKVYVLINGYSFSASTLLSANLKGINRATFVGEESGGGFNQCVAGRLPVIELKNSKLLLRFGLFQMTPNTKTDIYGRGVFPDIAISSTVEDKIKGFDRELDWVLNNTKTEK